MEDQRAFVRRMFDIAVAAADPFAAVSRHIHTVAPPALIVAFGKAAGGMAKAAVAHFEGTPCYVVTNYENAISLTNAKVYFAGHPVPNEDGAAAADAVLTAVASANGPILVLISGGGSSLLPAPVGGVTLEDKIALNKVLLSSGLDIVQMNLVRQLVSRLKGGGLLRVASPSHVTSLILSDVIGDDISAIASGPTSPPLGTLADARAVLVAAGLWDALPTNIQTHLSKDIDLPDVPASTNILVGSNAMSVNAMAAAMPTATVLPPIEGDVKEAASRICDMAQPGVTVWGGETTVHLRGSGQGGRNQELSLHIANEAASRGWDNWCCLQGGSDGRDGPTNAAGGIVDQDTLERIAANGGDIAELLANNDSFAALRQSGDLLMTGGTGTNVADIGILVR
jgi:hydroxypyruvate reductase